MRKTTIFWGGLLLCLSLAACFPTEEEVDEEDNNAVNNDVDNNDANNDVNNDDDNNDLNNDDNNDVGGDDSCEFANDGECDEPDLCAPGTDTTDCGVVNNDANNDPPPDGPGESYELSQLTVTSPEVVLLEGTEGLDIEDVTFSYRNEDSAVFGGWIANNSDEQLCFVGLDEATCVMSDGTQLAECVRGFITGQVGVLDTGSTTGTCMDPGQIAPVAGLMRLPDSLLGQQVTQISLRLDSRPDAFELPQSRLEIDGEVQIEGSNNFKVTGTVVNSGDADALIESANFRVLFVDDQGHVVATAFTEREEEGRIITPGETFEIETSRVLGLTVEDPIAEIIVDLDWEDAP